LLIFEVELAIKTDENDISRDIYCIVMLF
jgi:hypothetical protein